MMFMIYKLKKYFLELLKIFKYLVVKVKIAKILTILFLMKKLVGKYRMARYTSINHPSI